MNSKKLSWIISGLVLLLLMGGAVLLIQQRKAELAGAPASEERALPVSVTKTSSGRFEQSKHYLGRVEASQKSTLTPRVSGEIMGINIQEGDTVAPGDLLVRIDNRGIQKEINSMNKDIKRVESELQATGARIDSLEATVEYWESEFDRRKKLYERGTVSSSEFERSRMQYKNSRGELKAARREKQALNHRLGSLEEKLESLQVKKSYHRIESPYPARVSKKIAEEGEMAAPGRKLLVLEHTEGKKVTFQLPRDDLELLAEGQPVRYSYRGEDYSARLNLLYPSFEQNRLLTAEIWLEADKSPEIPAGSYLPLDVIYKQTEEQVIVDSSSLVEVSDGETYLFEVRDDRLVDRSVEVLGRQDDLVAVKGVKPGRRVVKHTYLGWTRLNAGREVMIADGLN